MLMFTKNTTLTLSFRASKLKSVVSITIIIYFLRARLRWECI